MAQLLTSAGVARRMGVGVTAVKRWADDGVLPCVRTAGGHRRFRLTDVERFTRHGAGAVEDPWRPWLDALVGDGDVHAGLALLFAERARRGAWSAVAAVLGELLEALGDRWGRGELTVAAEHVASSALERALILVFETMAVPAGAPRCLLAPAEGDAHMFGLLLAELCLREHGWRAVTMHAPTRAEDVCERIRAGEVRLVALSASSHSRDRRALRTQVRTVGHACQRAGITLALGGTGSWPDPPPFGVRVREWDDFTRLVQESAA